MTAILFQQNHHFIAFYSYAFRGREGFAKRVRCVRRENDEKNGRPLMSSTTVITVVILLLLLLL